MYRVLAIGWARLALIGAVWALLFAAVPAAAQFSDSYKFLKAVRDKDGVAVTAAVDSPGSTVINTRDYGSGETALHIVVKRRDAQWLQFLLHRGAKPDMRDNAGDTPLLIATRLGFVEGIQALLTNRAGVDVGNSRGETPLIVAVQNRDTASVRTLIAAGANPDRSDRVTGKSARDYAREDNRSAAILKLLDEAKPAKTGGDVAGPVM